MKKGLFVLLALTAINTTYANRQDLYTPSKPAETSPTLQTLEKPPEWIFQVFAANTTQWIDEQTLLERPSKHFTIQVAASSKKQPLRHIANQYLLKQVTIHKTMRHGQTWYVLLQGDYPSAAAAKFALPALGSELISRNKPWVRTIASIQNDARKQASNRVDRNSITHGTNQQITDSASHIPYHQVPDDLKLHNISKRHKDAQKANSVFFGMMTNLNYKSQNLSDDFLSKGKDSTTIGAIQLDARARINHSINVSAKASHYKNHGTPSRFKLDDARLVLGDTNESPLYFTLGYQYLPFGMYQPYSLTGSLTKELEEVQSTLLGLGYQQSDFYGLLYLYGQSGKVNNESRRIPPDGSNHGLELGYHWKDFHNGFQGHLTYLSNFREISLINNLSPKNLNRIDALSTHLNYYHGQYGALVDYVFSTGKFNSASMSYDNNDASPRAAFAEAYVRFHTNTLPSSIGLGYGRSWETLALQMPHYRLLTNYAILLNKHLSMQLQYTLAHNYGSSHTGTMNRNGTTFNNTGNDKTSHTIQAQMSITLGDEHPAMYTELTEGEF
jgi:hypothetical protein